jgi:putative transposase
MDDAEEKDKSGKPVAATRGRMSIEPGSFIQSGDKRYKISQVLDFEFVVGVDVESGRSTSLRLADLAPIAPPDTEKQTEYDLAEIADKDWRVASKRFEAIKPLLVREFVSSEEINARAQEVGYSRATLYRWLQRYKAMQVLTALLPRQRGWVYGKSRIPANAEAVIEEVIKDFYLTPQRPRNEKAAREVLRRCRLRGIEPPSTITIRQRISRIPEIEVLRSRGYREKARNKFSPAAGSFPNADYPLAVVQIDHTPADIMLVDDQYRKSIGRPWISIAMDVYSRMIVGYYLSFDAPSETSVAMCVAHAILPKDEWLLHHKVDAKWPAFGFPKTIHVDNGSDFRSENFRKSCLLYGINLEFRPLGQPRFGGHIERVIGTLVREIHDLPGTTFSSIKDREGYDSEKNAVMTISEFEEWLVGFICRVYNQRLHSSIGLPPHRKWEIGIHGFGNEPGVGLPPMPSNRQRLLLDFLPSFQRTAQTYGVEIDGVTYYAEALRHWIGSVDSTTGARRKLTFRRDPRDISTIWFFDPSLEQYFQIPYADQSLPSMSIWEMQQAKAKLKQEGRTSVNEHELAVAMTELRSRVDKSVEQTKKARRQAQKRKEHEKKISPASPTKATSASAEKSSSKTELPDLVSGDIDGFGDIA